MHNQSIKRKDDKKKKKIITRCTVYSLSLSFSELSSLGLSSRACDALDDCGDGKDGGMRFRKSGCAVLIPFTIHITACFCEIVSLHCRARHRLKSLSRKPSRAKNWGLDHVENPLCAAHEI